MSSFSAPKKTTENILLATHILESLKSLGVAEYCVCAGARNSPLVFLLTQSTGVRLHHFFEERSASFFALGRIKATGFPVAVVTTSGTAVAELLPAAVEATYAGLPLLLLTADRPRVYRGSGAPQAIEQMGIFSHYVQTTWDIESVQEQLPIETWSQKQPLHINVCFDEPLIDSEITRLDLRPHLSSEVKTTLGLGMVPSHIRKVSKPFVIVGGLRKRDREGVIQFLQRLQVPIYAEAISGLRGEPRLRGRLISNVDAVIGKSFEAKICETVLRIGSVPTLRFWRDLEGKFSGLSVYSISAEEWTGLSRRVHHTVGLQHINLFEVSALTESEYTSLYDLDQKAELAKNQLLQSLPQSETALIRDLSEKVAGHAVYLGNSLPIREWDLVAQVETAHRDLEANRGANGIDGQLSTFLGWAEGPQLGWAEGPQMGWAEGPHSESTFENWALVGDLTTMYDLAALWISKSLSETVCRRIVVVNNQGGQIFKNIFHNEAFINSHQVTFAKWAEMWGWDYRLWTEIPKNLEGLPKNVVIELKPSGAESDQFWQGLNKQA